MFEALRPKPRVSMRVKNFPLMDMRLFPVLLFALFMASEISQYFRFNRFFAIKMPPFRRVVACADYAILFSKAARRIWRAFTYALSAFVSRSRSHCLSWVNLYPSNKASMRLVTSFSILILIPVFCRINVAFCPLSICFSYVWLKFHQKEKNTLVTIFVRQRDLPQMLLYLLWNDLELQKILYNVLRNANHPNNDVTI